MIITWICAVLVTGLLPAIFAGPAMAEGGSRDALERRVVVMGRIIEQLTGQPVGIAVDGEDVKTTPVLVAGAIGGEAYGPMRKKKDGVLPEGLHFGGYGELHGNFAEGSEKDLFDIHRLVLYLGYDFADWIKLHTETEIEHAYVTDGAGGEISIEQAFVDFLLSDYVNIRVGRVLTPMGIVNQKHEPTTFNGVERPSFSKYIIPTTWSSDGVGIFGDICSALKYQLYVVSGLDGSMFTAEDGIRKGRIKERPSLHEPAVTGRLDYFPLAKHAAPHGQTLRVGASGYAGGLDNGNKGTNPGIEGDIRMFSGDFEYTISRLDFRGAIAHGDIDGADGIGNGAASEIFGWFVEAACHVMPESWKKGKLKKADAAVFVRYDDYDTQYRMPDGVTANPAGNREDITTGITVHLTPNLIVKADCQFRSDGTNSHLGTLFNLGVGFSF